jgi:hypothetical protein
LAKPGTITLPEDRFVELLVNAGRSLKSGGFTTVLLVGESGGNRTGMRLAAEKLNELWKDGNAKAFWIDDYYTKSHADQNKYITEKVGIPADQIGNHANILDTSKLLVVSAKHIRKNKLTGNDYPNNGVIRLLDGTRAYLHAVIDNFSRRILSWRVADTFAPVNTVAVLVEASRGATSSAMTPVVLADAGVENVTPVGGELPIVPQTRLNGLRHCGDPARAKSVPR